MSEVEEVKLHIKVVINKEKTKVLFAEADSDFTDVLLGFLLLPLGLIVRNLEKHYGEEAPVIGSLNTLYTGVANLDSIYFKEGGKSVLIVPTTSNDVALANLKLNLNYTSPTHSDPGKPYCGVFTETDASFIISDDLRVMPNVSCSIMKTLSNLGIGVADMDGAETRNVTFGMNEMLALLRGSLVCQNPLTALLFPGSQMSLATLKSQQGNTTLLHHIDEQTISMNHRKMSLTVTLLKSSKKLLFAQADHDFINFIFGMLTFPLGRVEWYLGSNTGLKSIDNLHQCIADNRYDKHLRTIIKCILIKPTQPVTRFIKSTNEFFPLNFDPKASRRYVKESRMYMVTDDLTVTTLGITSTLSVLDGLKISLSDVEELELQVGLEEGLSIVKAALTSTTALTDGLIKPMVKKQPKQENE